MAPIKQLRRPLKLPFKICYCHLRKPNVQIIFRVKILFEGKHSKLTSRNAFVPFFLGRQLIPESYRPTFIPECPIYTNPLSRPGKSHRTCHSGLSLLILRMAE
ncbi:hypothetical protein CEXT_689621 [Caerostris extrusa]|uniref:Uncharacterized protein n=1 Tax=Caerostris extrusa TaxID=172846 RepID=A0AAV4RC79_CAEEX|nr:hypothetical protein CEXT_689621 [Caerostris extrusa]